MDRLELTPEQQAYVDGWLADKASDTLNPMVTTTPLVPDTNLVQFDQVTIDTTWPPAILLGGDGDVGTYTYIPAWDYLDNVVLVDSVTDRAGPDGQTMPIFTDEQFQSRVAKAAAKNPKQAAKAERKEQRDIRRSIRETLDAQPDPKVRKRLHQQLVQHGLLGKDD